MATSTWATPIDHTSTTTFRTWGSELNSKLSAIGLVQTADTGQINWTTVNIPAINTDAGYEVWRFNDTQQPTSPIYIKLLYGTSNYGSNVPRLGWQVGSATNGAGVMAGQNTAPTYLYQSTGIGPTTTSYPSYLSYSDGFFALFFKYNAWGASALNPYLIISRTVDSTTQAPTSEGAAVYMPLSTLSSGYSMLRFISTNSIATGNITHTSASSWSGCAVPGVNTTTSIISTNPTVPRTFTHWSFTPTIRPMIGICTVNVNDIPRGTTFTATLFGSTPRTYLSMGKSTYGTPDSEVTASSSYCTAILWE